VPLRYDESRLHSPFARDERADLSCMAPGHIVATLAVFRQAIETHAEIGVFGHIERIPSAHLAQGGGAKMIRGAAKRDRQFHFLECGKNTSNCPAYSAANWRLNQPSAALSMESSRLHAGKLRRPERERRKRIAQLARLGLVLGVVNRHERAARKGQGGRERARLGLRAGTRRRNNFERRAELKLRHFQSRFRVVRFEQKFDVELLARIIELAQCAHELRDDRRLPIQRNDDRVDRQKLVGDIECRFRLLRKQAATSRRTVQLMKDSARKYSIAMNSRPGARTPAPSIAVKKLMVNHCNWVQP
jgi:hypothetical protein